MRIENRRQLENTRAKLKLLEQSLMDLKQQLGPNAYVDERTRCSLYTLIKQLKEEIALYEIRSVAVDAE